MVACLVEDVFDAIDLHEMLFQAAGFACGLRKGHFMMWNCLAQLVRLEQDWVVVVVPEVEKVQKCVSCSVAAMIVLLIPIKVLASRQTGNDDDSKAGKLLIALSKGSLLELMNKSAFDMDSDMVSR